MPKNTNRRSKPVKKDEAWTGTMKFFVAGCLAELYLLLIQKFYIHGLTEAQIRWYDIYLPVLIGVGAAALAVGAVVSFLWKADKKRLIGWYTAGGGAFVALAALMIRLQNAPALTLLLVVVPVVILLGILWGLYDRECAVALTILGVSLIAIWVYRREAYSQTLGTAAKAAAVIYLVLLAGAAFLARKAEGNKGRMGRLQLFPAGADYLPVYTACGLSAAAMAVALVSSAAGYYAMWGLALVVFALAVYYTVKQL